MINLNFEKFYHFIFWYDVLRYTLLWLWNDGFWVSYTRVHGNFIESFLPILWIHKINQQILWRSKIWWCICYISYTSTRIWIKWMDVLLGEAWWDELGNLTGKKHSCVNVIKNETANFRKKKKKKYFLKTL